MTYQSPVGGMLLSSDGAALTGLWFDGEKYYADTLEKKHEEKSLPVFEQTKDWLNIYFSGEEPDFLPDIYLIGTPFQLKVWNILQHIPYGTTITYGDIAKQIARQENIERMSAQAVGGAVGHNHISIIVPCHRVVGTNGSLTGYAGGLEKKIKLLSIEKVNMQGLYLP